MPWSWPGRGFGRGGRGFGRGFGPGWGSGGFGFGRYYDRCRLYPDLPRGWRRLFPGILPGVTGINPDTERRILEEERKYLEDGLNYIRKRLDDLTK